MCIYKNEIIKIKNGINGPTTKGETQYFQHFQKSKKPIVTVF